MKVAADGKKKFTILTTAPAGRVPTADELNGGIDASCQVLDSDANWSTTASDTFNEKAACQKGNSQALGASNYDLALTFLREWLAAGGADTAGLDAGYQAVKVKGTEVHIYLRETDKDSTEPWAQGDEIYLGGKVHTDGPARVDSTGNLKRRVVFLPQDMIEGEIVGPAPAAWAASTAYALGDMVTLSGGEVLEATTAGTSGTVEPTAPATVGGTVTDGTVTWTRRS